MKTQILNSQISVWNLSETAERLQELAQDGGKHYVCVANVHTVVMGEQDPRFADITNSASLATADGVPLIWASKVLGGAQIHGRASGPDILAEILTQPKYAGLKHYFYGSTPEVLERLEKKLRETYPQAQFAGFFSPPPRGLKKPDEPMTSEEIAECARIDFTTPHIVWVGLGAPKQEVWMYRARPFLKSPVLIGVGAAFDFLAGNKKRAPRWMQKGGLEWAYRLSQEPLRLFTRYMKTNPVFVAAVLKQALAFRLFKAQRMVK